jgi:hypothetical protein
MRHGELLEGTEVPYYAAGAYKGSLQRGMHKRTVGALNKTRIGDQVRLERHMRHLKGLYTGEGLSLKLGTKGETVNKAKYSTGSGREAWGLWWGWNSDVFVT